jgi:hypothetical protein
MLHIFDTHTPTCADQQVVLCQPDVADEVGGFAPDDEGHLSQLPLSVPVCHMSYGSGRNSCRLEEIKRQK